MNTTLEQQWQRVATRHGAHLKPPKQIDRGLVSSQDANIAKFCYIDKQPITNRGQYAGKVPKPSLNELLVANLGRIKDARDLTLPYIAKQCGLSQRTIGYYLDPDKRAPTRSGKLGSAKLNEIDALARGLGVSVWDLLGDGSAGPSRTYSYHAEVLAMKFDQSVPINSAQSAETLMAAMQAIDAAARPISAPLLEHIPTQRADKRRGSRRATP